MRWHFSVKFVWGAALLLAFVGAGGSPAFAAQEAKGPLRVTVSRDGVTTGSGGKTALAAAGPCAAPVASTSQGGIVTRGVSDQLKNAAKKR